MLESLILIIAVVAGFVVVMTKDMAPAAPKVESTDAPPSKQRDEKSPVA